MMQKKHSLISMANKRYDLGIGVLEDESDNDAEPQYCMSVQGFLRSAPNDEMWDLHNHDLADGIIKLPLIMLNRLVSFIIGRELIKNFQKASYDGDINPKIIEKITDTMSENSPNRLHLNSTAIPPCMLYCKQTLENGEHLPYNGRFALAAFHGKRHMPPDDIVTLFENAPDYKEGTTRMHVGNILEKKLMPYSCGKMEQYGLCKRHERCGTIKNPLSYR